MLQVAEMIAAIAISRSVMVLFVIPKQLPHNTNKCLIPARYAVCCACV